MVVRYSHAKLALALGSTVLIIFDMPGDGFRVEVEGKVSKNCASCLGYHPAPFGKGCKYLESIAESSEETTMADQGVTQATGGQGIIPSPKKSPLPSRREHLAKLLEKEEAKKAVLEVKRKEMELEHQLAALRVTNRDIERDMAEAKQFADKVGLGDRDATFRPGRGSPPVGSEGEPASRNPDRRGSGGTERGWRPPPGLQSVQQELAAAGIDTPLGLGILPEEYDDDKHGGATGMSDGRGLLSSLQALSLRSKRKRSHNILHPDYHLPVDKEFGEMSVPEMWYGMSSIFKALLTHPPREISVLGYVNHMQFVAYKAMTGAFDSKTLAQYDRKVTKKVMEGTVHDYMAGEEEAMTSHLAPENMTVVQDLLQRLKKLEGGRGQGSGQNQGAKKAYKHVVQDYVCAKYNFNWCDLPQCNKQHVCTFCGGTHKGKACRSRNYGEGRQQMYAQPSQQMFPQQSHQQMGGHMAPPAAY